VIDTRSEVYPAHWLPSFPPPPRRLGTSPVQRAEGGKNVFLSLGHDPEEGSQVFLSLGRSPGEMSRYETEGVLRTVIGG
jgi:hypothetical protein